MESSAVTTDEPEKEIGPWTEPQKEGRWVTMSNALIRAGQGLSLIEKRVVAIAISKLDKGRIPKPGEVPRTKITAQEYADLAECEMSTAYEALQTASKSLFNRKITIFEAAHKRSGKTLKPAHSDMRWCGRCTYHDGEGWVELAWWPELLPHLIALSHQFTKYQLAQGCALRSVYTWRLMELLMRFQSTGWAEYDIDDFATSMGASDKQRADFAAIRRKMIEPAVAELHQKDGWDIVWKANKVGRKVKSIYFEFARVAQHKLPF